MHGDKETEIEIRERHLDWLNRHGRPQDINLWEFTRIKCLKDHFAELDNWLNYD